MAISDDDQVYAGTLDVTVPTDAANISKGAAEIRQVKTQLKTSFPNINGAVTATDTQLNFVDATSSIQTQLDAKLESDAGALDGPLVIQPGPLTIRPDGAVAATGQTAGSDADGLVIDSTSNAGLSILSSATGVGSIFFGDTTDNGVAGIKYTHDTVNKLTFTVNAADRLQVGNDGRMRVLTATYEALLDHDDDIPNKKYVDDGIAANGYSISRDVEVMNPYALSSSSSGPHNLSSTPDVVSFYMVCIANDSSSGYSAGDRLAINGTDLHDDNRIHAGLIDATNVTYITEDTIPRVVHKTTNAKVNITLAKWKVVATCVYFG